jgi:hypothetical protein
MWRRFTEVLIVATMGFQVATDPPYKASPWPAVITTPLESATARFRNDRIAAGDQRPLALPCGRGL